jgi:hypothetical protein
LEISVAEPFSLSFVKTLVNEVPPAVPFTAEPVSFTASIETTEVETLAESFVVFESNGLEEVREAVFVIVVPPVPAFAVAVMVSVADAPFARAPMVHTPVVEE